MLLMSDDPSTIPTANRQPWLDWRPVIGSEPRGNRTPNPLIKSQLLCQIELAAQTTHPLYFVLQGLSNQCAFPGQVADHKALAIRLLC
jgi:hypothetical protein